MERRVDNSRAHHSLFESCLLWERFWKLFTNAGPEVLPLSLPHAFSFHGPVFLWLCFWASLLPRNSTCQRLWLDFRHLKCLGTFCWVRSINFWEVKYIWNYWGISHLICLELSRTYRRQNCFKSGRSGKKVEPPWTPAGINCLLLPPKPYKFLTTRQLPCPTKSYFWAHVHPFEPFSLFPTEYQIFAITSVEWLYLKWQEACVIGYVGNVPWSEGIVMVSGKILGGMGFGYMRCLKPTQATGA